MRRSKILVRRQIPHFHVGSAVLFSVCLDLRLGIFTCENGVADNNLSFSARIKVIYNIFVMAFVKDLIRLIAILIFQMRLLNIRTNGADNDIRFKTDRIFMGASLNLGKIVKICT